MAAGRNLTARLLLVLTDRATAGLAALQRRIQGIAALSRRIGAIGTIGGGLAFASLVPQAAAFETQLRDIAITAGATRDQVAGAVADMRRELQTLAVGFRESSQDLAGGLGTLIARGLDPSRARDYLAVLAEIRSASGAATAELAQLAVATDRIAQVQGLDEMRQAMAVALRGGQLGGAELRDMARYLPGVLAQMGALETRGMRAVQNSVAMFQVLRDGFGTMEEAAAGAQQLLGHLLSDATTRRAGELGINLRGVYEDALRRMRAGEDIDPVEALLQSIRRLTAADPSRIFELLPDQNSRQAFLAFNAQLERYLDIRRQLRETTPETTAQTGQDRRQGLGADMRLFNENLAQLGDRLGNALGSGLPIVNQGLAVMRELLADLDARFPGLIDGVARWGVALVGLTAAFGVLGTLVALLNPIGAAIGLVAAGVLLVATNWETVQGVWARATADLADSFGQIGTLASGMWTSASAAFAGFIAPIAGRLAEMTDAVAAAAREIAGAFDRLWSAARAGFDEFISWIRRGLQPIEDLLSTLSRAWERLRRPAEPGTGGVEAPPATAPTPGQQQRSSRWGERGRIYPQTPSIELQSAPGARSSREWSGRIEISLQPGLQLRRAEVQQAAVTFTSGLSRGAMLRTA